MPQIAELKLPFKPPSRKVVSLATAPVHGWFSPVFLNTADVSRDRPAMLVGNHTLLGVLDVPVIVDQIYQTTGVMVRSLGDHVHFQVPGWRNLLERFGAVDGTPANCAALMSAGESVFVYPGGAREVFRRRSEKYSLIWKNRIGFARMALEHGYDLIPFASVGADEAYEILWDADDFLANPAAKALAERASRLGISRNGDLIPPIVRGIGPTLVPRPQRFYISFGARISSITASGGASGDAAAWRVRESVAQSINQELQRLIAYRAEHLSAWSHWRRMLAPVSVTPAR